MRRALLFLLVAGCGQGDLLQGDEYLPNGELATGPAGQRPDAASCDGGPCDAGTDAPPPPVLPIPATPPSNTCETARAIGALAGDEGTPTQSAQGTCSEWLSIRLREDDASALGAVMKARFTLSPAAEFDLFVYFDAIRDQRSCAVPYAGATTVGSSESVSLTWGEGTIANGEEDSRTIGIAILKTGGPCNPGSAWTLSVEGNR